MTALASSHPQTPANDSARRGSSKVLYALLAVSLLPIAAAYFAFFTGIGVPEHTVNRGRLLAEPMNVKQLLSQGQGDFLLALQQQKKWRLLIPLTANCNEACAKILYTTRQVHIRLGEKSTRVERVAMNIDGQAGLDYFDTIKAQHPKLHLVTVTAEQWQQWLAATDNRFTNDPFYLLVDQEGFAMMTYNTDVHGNDLLKDLKRALKFSIDYQNR